MRSIDGVTVQNPYAFSGSNKSYPAGEIVLDGPDALSFARERKGLPSGDFHRSWNQGADPRGPARSSSAATSARTRRDVRRGSARACSRPTPRCRCTRCSTSRSRSTQLRPTRVTNLVATGTTATVGGTSVVNLSSENQALWADMAKDGFILEKDDPGRPPSPACNTDHAPRA